MNLGHGRTRHAEGERDHHDHLIGADTGRVIGCADPEIKARPERIAARLG